MNRFKLKIYIELIVQSLKLLKYPEPKHIGLVHAYKNKSRKQNTNLQFVEAAFMLVRNDPLKVKL